MGKKPDLRNIINPHRNCGRDAQLTAIHADSERMGWPVGETYIQTRKGNETETGIRSLRRNLDGRVRAMWLFNLAPIDGTAAKKRRAMADRIKAIHKSGGLFREAATGLQSDDPGDLVTMTNRASKMVTDYAKGAAGQGRTGRPRKPRTETELAAMKQIWEGRKAKTVNDAVLMIEQKGIRDVNKNELYRLFGPRG